MIVNIERAQYIERIRSLCQRIMEPFWGRRVVVPEASIVPKFRNSFGRIGGKFEAERHRGAGVTSQLRR